MKLKIVISMDNAAFEENNGTEAARILRRFADEIDGCNYPVSNIIAPLRDINGNHVGTAKVTR